MTWLLFLVGWALIAFLLALGWAACHALAARRQQARTDAAEQINLGVYLARRALR